MHHLPRPAGEVGPHPWAGWGHGPARDTSARAAPRSLGYRLPAIGSRGPAFHARAYWHPAGAAAMIAANPGVAGDTYGASPPLPAVANT